MGYVEVNRSAWDTRVAAHAASPDYALEQFRSDPSFLSAVVRFDLPRLGDLKGLRGVHLQCHIGTDTVSLARLGASMTGLDFSEPAIAVARDLASATGDDARFVQAELYDAPETLGRGAFDLVYTGVGALCWLPDIERWAAVVADLLAPGGRLFIREAHPVLWALDDARPDGLLALEYPYFGHEEPLVWEEEGTYVTTEERLPAHPTHNWNHGLGEIVTALLDRSLRLTMLVEHDSVPWEALEGQMERLDGDERRVADRPARLPHTYTLQAVRDL